MNHAIWDLLWHLQMGVSFEGSPFCGFKGNQKDNHHIAGPKEDTQIRSQDLLLPKSPYSPSFGPSILLPPLAVNQTLVGTR